MVLEGHPEGCQSVHQLGGLPPLMQMLSNGGAQAKRAAAEVLQALAAEHMPLKTEIAAAGAVPLLVSLLRQGEPQYALYPECGGPPPLSAIPAGGTTLATKWFGRLWLRGNCL